MLKIFKILLVTFLLLVAGYFYFFKPYEVVGRPVSPFIKGQIVLASKLFYFFKEPLVGDRVIFYPNKGSVSYIGIITSIENDTSVLVYDIDSGTEKGEWQVTSDKLSEYIWYPFISR